MTNLLCLAVAVLSLVLPQAAFVPPADMQTVHVVLLMKGPKSGTGQVADWAVAQRVAATCEVLLAGGLKGGYRSTEAMIG